MGVRYRLHRKDLPGRPDIVLASRRKAILVHGCFWHQHPGCRRATIPKSNRAYWVPKLARNIARDRHVCEQLGAQGWKYLIIWECETVDPVSLGIRLWSFIRDAA